MLGPVREAIAKVPTLGRGLTEELPGAVARAIEVYTKGSRKLNEFLARQDVSGGFDPFISRDYILHTPEGPMPVFSWIFNLVRGVRMLVDVGDGGLSKIFRGCALTARQVKPYRKMAGKRKTVQWLPFASCSRSENVAKAFAAGLHYQPDEPSKPVIFEIHRKPSHPTAAYIDDYSYYPGEKEVLMIPGCRFKVKEFKDASSDDGCMRVVLQEVQLESHI